MAPKKKIGYCPPPKGITINANTIIGLVSSVIAGMILWSLTNAKQEQRKQSDVVKELSFTVPAVEKSVASVADSVKEIAATVHTMEKAQITREELNGKQARTEKAISEVKDDVKEIKQEQDRVSEEIRKK